MKKFLEVLAALAALAAFGWDPPRHDGTFTRDGVTYVQYGGLSQESYVVTNVAVAGGGGLDTNAVERIANMAVETNATITAHAEAIVTNAAEIAAIPRITESPTNPGWAANAEGARDAVNATYASMAERLGNYKEDDLSEMENAISSHSSQLFQQSQSIADNAVAIAAETDRATAAETAAVLAATNYTDAATNALSLSVSHPTSLWSDENPKSAGCTNRMDSFGNLYKGESVAGGSWVWYGRKADRCSRTEWNPNGPWFRWFDENNRILVEYWAGTGILQDSDIAYNQRKGDTYKGLDPFAGDDLTPTGGVIVGNCTFTPQGAPVFSPTPYDRFARASELPEVGTNAVLAANAYTDAATNAVAQSVAAETDRATAAETAAVHAATNYTDAATNALAATIPLPYTPDPADPGFSSAVLAVGLNIDTNSVAVLNEIAATFGGFPIEGAATTIGGLLAALAAAVAWLKRNKITNPDGGTVGNVLKKTADGVEWGEGGEGDTTWCLKLDPDTGNIYYDDDQNA